MCGLLALLPAGASAQAFSPSKFYFAGYLDRLALGVDSSSAELQPLVAGVSAGYWLLEGVGLELDAGTGVTDDSVGSLDVDFRSGVALSVRFESPPAERFGAYALFGYARTSYRTSLNGATSTLSLPGGRLALGLTYGITRQIAVDAAFTHHDLDGDTRINSFRLGVRYDLGSRGTKARSGRN